MPRRGYKSITISERVHQELKKRAHQTNRTLKEYVEYLLLAEKSAEEGR